MTSGARWAIALLLFTLAACSSSTAPTAPLPMAPSTPMQPEPGPPAPAPAPATARYQVTFDATWSRTSHPQDPPDDPHFSPLIGATHASTVTFWQAGGLASAGIQRMAETGSTSPLDAEMQAAITAGTAERLLRGPNLSDSPGMATIEFDVSQAFPLVTLVTMVAPSPDWFTGTTALALFENGAWREEVRVEVFAYDAGTDSGVSFMSADQETRPHVPITRITGFPFLVNGQVPPLGTMTFRRMAPGANSALGSGR